MSENIPFECFKFVTNIKEYLYTSSDKNIVLNNDTYVPETISRDALKLIVNKDNTLNITIDRHTDLIKDYIKYLSPPAYLNINIYRGDINDIDNFYLLWAGQVIGIDINKNIAKLSLVNILAQQNTKDLPSIYYQNPCNHVLYDNKCGLKRKDHQYPGTVGNIDNLNITVTGLNVATNILAAGEMVLTRTNEHRGINKNENEIVTISYPFTDLKISDNVVLYAGCDHSYKTCINKFNNGNNYGGMPYIPIDNPFQGEIS